MARKAEEPVILSEVLIIIALAIGNGVLAGSEIAIVSLRKTRLRELVEAGSGSARAVERLRETPERFLATVQIGITVIGATAGAFGGASFARDLEPILADIPLLAPHASALSFILVVSLVSYLSLVIGELVPKSLALRSAERYALFIGRPLLLLSRLTGALVWFLTQSSNLVLRIFGDRTTFMESRISPEELGQMVTEAASEGGTLHPAAGQMAARALELPDLSVSDVMVPRNRVTALSVTDTPDEVRATIRQNMHTRYPVYDGDIDHIVGYVSVKDFLGLAWDRKDEQLELKSLLRKPYFVPETLHAVDLLEDMRRRRLPMAFAVDEAGGLAGLVTVEDLVEEIVGELYSEHDVSPHEDIRPDGERAWIVPATVPIRDLNRALELDLPEEGDWSTISGLTLALAGRIPAAGETVIAPNGVTIEVLDASPRRVRTLRILAPEPRAADSDGHPDEPGQG